MSVDTIGASFYVWDIEIGDIVVARLREDNSQLDITFENEQGISTTSTKIMFGKKICWVRIDVADGYIMAKISFSKNREQFDIEVRKIDTVRKQSMKGSQKKFSQDDESEQIHRSIDVVDKWTCALPIDAQQNEISIIIARKFV